MGHQVSPTGFTQRGRADSTPTSHNPCFSSLPTLINNPGEGGVFSFAGCSAEGKGINRGEAESPGGSKDLVEMEGHCRKGCGMLPPEAFLAVDRAYLGRETLKEQT